ncbi:hypothetical protein QUF49_02630 [Fictibacillus sp. b24]|uniref:hypothetical protein n=1 Tax=Fictibacillus sp. b24 TaxID=3055863 RepID=UPI0025A01DC1|nr:hypothetical protein [Fictibacillus sp. b24]MDM5314871.1 hypothetical protein [Fictibacillus sp. b24]
MSLLFLVISLALFGCSEEKTQEKKPRLEKKEDKKEDAEQTVVEVEDEPEEVVPERVAVIPSIQLTKREYVLFED